MVVVPEVRVAVKHGFITRVWWLADVAWLQAAGDQLVGSPVNLSSSAMAARLRAAIPFGTPLGDITPAMLAQAVIRGISPGPIVPERIGSFTVEEVDRLTKGWKSYPWRIIPEQSLSPAVNLALDEITPAPTVRFWKWNAAAVVLGRSQSLLNEVELEAAGDSGIEVLRRVSGGGTMFIEPEGAITYSLILPEDALAGLSIRQSYEICDAWAVRALRDLDLDAHYIPINDIGCSLGKIGGAAQARRRGMVIHHSTLAYSMDTERMIRVLRLGKDTLYQKGVRSAQKVVAPLIRQTDLPRESIVNHLMWSFRQLFGGEERPLTSEELAGAKKLEAEKYTTREWIENE